MALRVFLLFLFCSFYQLQVCAVGTINTAPKTEKVGFFKKIRKKILTKKLNKLIKKHAPGDCDVVSLYAGYDLNVSVIEVQDHLVLYQLCNEPDAPIDSLSCEYVDVIYLKDGTQYKCSHPSLPRRSENATFSNVGKANLIPINLQCDILVMMNKDQLNVDIVDVRNDYLLYKNCGEDTAVIDSFALNEIRTYRKKNGYSERVNSYTNERSDASNMASNFIRTLFLLGLFLFALILFIFFVANN